MAARSPTGIPTAGMTFDRAAQFKTALVVAAFIGAFWNLLDFIPPDFGSLVSAWVNDSNWSHGPIIPLFAAYLVYQNWERVRRCAIRHTWLGFVLLSFGLLAYLYAQVASPFGVTRELSMMLALLGVLIALCGLPMMRVGWVPYLFLFFAIPIPTGIYFALTNPLRQLAARVASSVLGLIPGLSIDRLDSEIDYVRNGVSGTISVADACSGMRSTITLCAIGVAVAFLSNRPWWHRFVLVASCVPIATFCNFIRVTVTCWLQIYVGVQYAHGTYHTMLGLAVLLLALGLFSALGWVLDHVFVEEPDGPAEQAA